MFNADSYLQTLFAECVRDESDLHDYQNFAVEWVKENPFSALFIDVGLGKTIIILTLIDWLVSRGCDLQILIIAPIKVCNRVWGPEIRAWFHTAYLRYHNLRIEDDDPRLVVEYKLQYARWKAKGKGSAEAGRMAKRIVNELKEELRREQLDNPAQIHIINQEAVPWLVGHFAERNKNKVTLTKRWPYKIVVFDESSRLRDHKSLVFLALKCVRDQIERFHQLTATPAAQTYMYFFSQFWLLDKGERFGNFITHYRERYFVRGYDGHSYALRPGADREIEIRISDISLTMRKQDHLDMADPIIRVKDVRLPFAVKKKYADFEREFVLELPDNEFIEAVNGGALSIKLLQLASGAVYDAIGDYHVFHDEKIEALRTILDETLHQPVLVAYWFKSSLDRLRIAFPTAAVMDKQGRMEGPWNQGRFKTMLVHPAGVGHGLNLQHGGHHLVIFDLFWSVELFLQLIGRLNRQGQLETVIVHLLSAVGTYDRIVSATLRNLEDAQEAMFRRLQALRKRMKSR